MKAKSKYTRKMQLYFILLVSVYAVKVSSQNLDVAGPIKDNEEFSNPNLKLVPFGHIFRSGIEDDEFGGVEPIDLLELQMRFPISRQEELHALRTRSKKTLLKIDKSYPFGPAIPRDLHVDEFSKGKDQKSKVKTSNDDDDREWFKFEEIQKQNLQSKLPKQPLKRITYNNTKKIMPPIKDEKPKDRYKNVLEKATYFSQGSYDVPRFNQGFINWTTCEEFEKGIGPNNVVYPKDIVDIEWEPFYIWSERKHLYSIPHKFKYPTKKIVQEYKELYGKFLPKTVDWEQPKLVLNERMEMLLIAADRKGLFHGIPNHNIPPSVRHKNITIPTIVIRLKVVDPYLALMYCNNLYATIMASSENLPQTDREKFEEATLLKFVGEGYPVSRNKYLEKLKVEKRLEQKRQEEARKIIHALPGYPGIDDIAK